MSTRSCIARPIGDEWEGRYHHSDGYPTGLGAELWRLVQLEGVEWARRVLIDEHPAGWSCILEADWSLPTGFRAHTTMRDLQQPRGPRCYCHGDRKEPAEMIHSRDEKDRALFIEWVYVLGAMGMAIYSARSTGTRRRRRMKDTRTGAWRSWDEAVYRWIYLDTYQWNGAEPNWNAIETADAAACEGAHDSP